MEHTKDFKNLLSGSMLACRTLGSCNSKSRSVDVWNKCTAETIDEPERENKEWTDQWWLAYQR